MLLDSEEGLEVFLSLFLGCFSLSFLFFFGKGKER